MNTERCGRFTQAAALRQSSSSAERDKSEVKGVFEVVMCAGTCKPLPTYGNMSSANCERVIRVTRCVRVRKRPMRASAHQAVRECAGGTLSPATRENDHMGSSARAGARNEQGYRGDGGRSHADGLEEFAAWIERLMRLRDYDIDSPRGGGKSKLADDAGVHRAAVSRLLQRQSMPDLETMRRLAGVLDVPLRDMLIRSGRLSEDDLPIAASRGGQDEEGAQLLSPEEAALRMGVPPELRELFVRVTKAFLPQSSERGEGAGSPGV